MTKWAQAMNVNYHYTSNSPAETIALGRKLGAGLPTPACILLRGNLGAGKTQLVRGIALGAQVADPKLVSSPTYVLLNIYLRSSANSASKTVYHIDAYRMAGRDDAEALGLDELLADPDGLVVIEWPERLAGLLSTSELAILDITLEPLDEQRRYITISGAERNVAPLRTPDPPDQAAPAES